MSMSNSFSDNVHFTPANIPFGVISLKDKSEARSIATRLYGDVYIIPDLIQSGLLSDVPEDVQKALSEPTLNTFASFPRSTTRTIRESIQQLISTTNPKLESYKHPLNTTQTHLPFRISDFTDFSCSLNHVLNASEAMTGRRASPPCFLHYPPGYSGRCSSIVPSGTSIRRPRGQFRDKDGQVVYGESQMVDFELEVGAIVGRSTSHGTPVDVQGADEHLFGLVLLNDWSSRDIQALEMPPLGPLNGKSFGTTISPWVITLDALEPFRVPLTPRDPSVTVVPYLSDNPSKPSHYDITTQVHIVTESSKTVVCNSNFRSLYWSLAALVAHQTSNGCPLNTGDVLGTGTISGSEPGSYGCLLEATKGGKQSVALEDGQSRVYLQDGDGVRLTAWAGELGSDSCVGFGEAFGILEHAIEL